MRRATLAWYVRRRKAAARNQLRYPSAGVTGWPLHVARLDKSIQFFGDLLWGRAAGLYRHTYCTTVEGGQTVPVCIG